MIYGNILIPKHYYAVKGSGFGFKMAKIQQNLKSQPYLVHMPEAPTQFEFGGTAAKPAVKSITFSVYG